MIFKRVAVLVMAFAVVACASTPEAPTGERQPTVFTGENIVKLRFGMTSDEVVAIFGYPLKAEADVCGEKTQSPWKCITWWYNSKSNARATRLVFEVHQDVLYLNSWVTN